MLCYQKVHDRQTTQYIDNRARQMDNIDNRVTAAHVCVCWTDRQTDTTDRPHSISTTVLDRWIINLHTLHYFLYDQPDPLLHRQLIEVSKVKDPVFEEVGIG